MFQYEFLGAAWNHDLAAVSLSVKLQGKTIRVCEQQAAVLDRVFGRPPGPRYRFTSNSRSHEMVPKVTKFVGSRLYDAEIDR